MFIDNVFYNKNKEEMLFVSPVSGELVEIVRGARRRILTLKFLADKQQVFQETKIKDLEKVDASELKKMLL